MNLISLFVVSVLSSNIVLTKFLGVCSFIGVSKNKKNALGMGLTVILVVTLASIITYFMYYFILVPSNTTYLKTVLFILVISGLVQMTDIVIKKYFPILHKNLGIYLPLITTNCAILGVILLNINSNYNLLETIIYSIGSGIGYTIVIFVFSSIRERLDQINTSKSFRGVPIAFITATIMALLFGRYIGS